MPSGQSHNFPPSFLLGRAKVVQGFGCSVAISQLRRMIHLAVECNNVPGSQQRGRAQFPFKAESTSLWFWPSSHPHSTQALAQTPPTSASFKGNKASHLILKLKPQREQNIFLVLAISCSFGHQRWEITDLAVRTNRGPLRLSPCAMTRSRCTGDPWLTSLGCLRQNIPFLLLGSIKIERALVSRFKS